MRIGLFIPATRRFFPTSASRRSSCWTVWPLFPLPRDPDLLRPPMATSGFNAESPITELLFVRNFSGSTTSSSPSACVHHLRDNFDAIRNRRSQEVPRADLELVEFLHDIQKVDRSLGHVSASGWLHTLRTRCASARASVGVARAVLLQAPSTCFPSGGNTFVTGLRTNAAALAAPSVCEEVVSTKIG